MAARKKSAGGAPAKERTATRSRRKKPEVTAIETAPSDLAIDAAREAALAPIVGAVQAEGGAVIGAWKDPLGGHPLLLASLPIDRVAPTPFQRDPSPTHVRKLANAIGKTRRYLDPIVVMREDDGRWLTPNGNHRLTAMRELGAKAIVALVVPERQVAYQILALNVEKAHNLRERATEVRRMIVDLAGWAKGSEKDFELELEEPSLVTLGFAYEQRPRISGGAYAPVLKRVDRWVEGTLADAVEERKRRAGLVIVLDDAVEEAVSRLKEAGLTSPYLKSFVVARIHSLRFIKGDPPPMDELLPQMARRAREMDASRISASDLARSGGALDEED